MGISDRQNMKDEKDDNSAGLVLLGLICLGVYWLFKKCTVNSRNRTVLVPVDQLNQHAHADREQLSQLEAIAVSNVSKDFLGVEAAIHSSGRFRKFVTVLVVLVLAVAMWQFPHRYFTEPNHYNTLQVERSATGNQCVSWSTQLGVIAMFATTFLMEMSLRGALGMESRDWDASLGFDEFTNYQKAITCRGWFLFVLSGALVVGALAKGPSTEVVNRSYFNAILLQQSNMMNRIQNQDATIEALTTKLKGK